MPKLTKKSNKKQTNPKKSAEAVTKVSKSKIKKDESKKVENEMMEAGDHKAILDDITKKEEKVPVQKKDKVKKTIKKNDKKVSKTSERKFVQENDDESESEEEVYNKLFPTKIKMDEEKEDQEENETDDLGFGKPLKLIVPKESKKAEVRKQVAKMAEEKKKESPELNSDVIYLGHIPNGFFEKQLKAYFSQFGNVVRVRVSRSHRTGKSRGYGFLQFDDPFVAYIAADTMDKHRAFGRTLVCKVVPKESQHPDMWRWAKFPSKKFNLKNFREQIRLTYNSKLSDEEYEEKLRKLLEQEAKLRQKIKDAGINYTFPGYEADMKAKKIKLSEKKDTDESME